VLSVEFHGAVGLAFGDDLAAAAPHDHEAVADVEDRVHGLPAAGVLRADAGLTVGSRAAAVSLKMRAERTGLPAVDSA
jgi:hypothetical protein